MSYSGWTRWKHPSATRTYYAWRSMRARCSTPTNDSYPCYGGRGIAVCDAWRDSYDVFYEDMGECPPGLTLERLDTDGNYCPENCVWVTHRMNSNNRRSTVRVGGEPLSVAAERLGIKPDTLWKRLKRYNCTDATALTVGRLNKPQPAEHGTRRRYERDGCRCALCNAFNAKRARLHRQTVIARARVIVAGPGVMT